MDRSVSLAAVLLVVGSTPAAAQLQRTLDIGGGVTAGTALGAGAQIGFEVRHARMPISLRFDGSYHQWYPGLLNGGTTWRAAAGTANLVYRLPTVGVRPYVVGGIGAYALQGETGKTGWNAGVGFEVPRGQRTFFAELRTHHISSTSQRLVPLVIGVRF